MNKPLDPKLDVVFKLMFTRPGSESMLLALLDAVLRPTLPIVSVTVLNPEIEKNAIKDRGIVLDLRLRLQDNSQVNVEMQTDLRPGMRKRILYHWARMYASQLVRGDRFAQLVPCASVFLLGYDELLSARFHSTFQVREVHDHGLLTDQLELHVVQLRQMPARGSAEAIDERSLVGWGRFLMAKDEREREEVAMSDPTLQKAKEVLDELSADPVAQRLAADREEGFLLYQFELAETRKLALEEGREEGETRGRAAALLAVLTSRGLTVADEERARIEACTDVASLDRWIARATTAATVAEVLVEM